MVALFLIAATIGITLGLFGAGGSILAVPVLVYVGGVPPTLASGYAFFIVMVATTVASVPHVKKRRVDWASFWWFGITTMTTIFIIRRWALPAIPRTIVFGGWSVELDTLLMAAFGIVLLAAGGAMLRHTKSGHVKAAPSHPSRLLVLGVVVGLVAGFLGVGGGFLMTPALVLWAGLEMKPAVATSLALISVNSAVGVAGDMIGNVQYDWPFVLMFTAITTVGILVGVALSSRVDGTRLKVAFGWVVVFIGVAVLFMESIR